MKKLLSIIFVAVALNASAQEMLTETTDTVYPQSISLKEISNISYKNGLLGKGSLTTTLFNGAEYTVKTSDNVSTKILSAKESVAQGKYKNMRFLKNFDSLEEFAPGDVIGILDEQDYTTTDFPTTAYTDLYGMESLFQAAFTANIAAYALSNLVTTDYIHIRVVNIVYASKDADGQIIPLSARLIYPYCTAKRLNLMTLYMDHHTTLFDDDTAPSFAFGNMPLCGMVGKGYYVVEPDLIGFGVSTDRTQMYIDNENNPRNAADCALAAVNYAKYSQSNTSTEKPAYLSSSATMINAGGSQGGYTALAMEKYIENDMDKTAAAKLPKISECRIYAAPSDPLMTIDKFTKLDTLRMSVTLPMIVQGAVVAHPEMMVDEEGNPYTVHDFFISDMKTRKWNFSEYGLNKTYNIWQLMNSKKLNSSMFIWALCSTWGQLVETGYKNVTFGWMLAHRVMAKGTLNNDGTEYSLNYDDQRIKALASVLKRYIITDNTQWVPRANIHIVAADDDRWVPYENTTEFINNMQTPMNNLGYSLTLETLHDTLAMGGHGVTCYIWMLSELYGITTTAALDIIKELQNAQSSN